MAPRVNPSKTAYNGAVTPDHSFLKFVTKTMKNAKIENKRDFSTISCDQELALVHANAAEPTTSASNIRHRFMVWPNVAASPTTTESANLLSESIGLEELNLI